MNLVSLEDALAVHLEDQCTSLQSRQLKRAHLTVEDVFKACGTLLDVIEDEVYFIHQSVKDYFEQEDPLKSLLETPPRLVPAYACLAYLSSEDFRQERIDFDEFPFLDYAHRCWHLHIESAADILNSDGLQDLLVQLLAPMQLKTWSYRIRLLVLREKSTHAWCLLQHDEDEFSPSLTSHVAIEYDIGWLARLLLDNSVAELPNDFPKNCLSIAASALRGHHVLRVMLVHSFPKLRKRSIESIARTQNHTTFLILIMMRRQDVRINGDVAAAAADNLHHAKEVMELLLLYGGDSIQINSDLFEKAARNPYSGERLLELLFDGSGGDVDITSGVLEAAARNVVSGADILILLFSKMSERTKITQDVVVKAARNELIGDQILKLLIDRGVKIGIGVLKAAVRNSRAGLRILNLLYNERKNEVHVTADVLAAAAANSRHGDKILALLLSDFDRHAAGLRITDDTVIAAAGNDSCGFEVMQSLLNWQPGEVHITMEVQMATEKNTDQGKAIMMLLLRRRADDTHVTEYIAERILEHLPIDVMRLIRERRDDSHFMCQHVTQLLAKNFVYLATLEEQLDDLETLLALGADADFVSDDGWTPLTLAAERGDLSVVELLLANKADSSMVTASGWSLLGTAAYYGRVEIIRLLLNRGAAVNEGGLKPLVLALSQGRVGVIKLLLERQANINATGPDGWTPLAAASYNGHFSAFKLLLGKMQK
jgi:hypothetical protein